MTALTSEHFTPLPLSKQFNCQREALDESLRLSADEAFGRVAMRGIPFELGAAQTAQRDLA